MNSYAPSFAHVQGQHCYTNISVQLKIVCACQRKCQFFKDNDLLDESHQMLWFNCITSFESQNFLKGDLSKTRLKESEIAYHNGVFISVIRNKIEHSMGSIRRRNASLQVKP